MNWSLFVPIQKTKHKTRRKVIQNININEEISSVIEYIMDSLKGEAGTKSSSGVSSKDKQIHKKVGKLALEIIDTQQNNHSPSSAKTPNTKTSKQSYPTPRSTTSEESDGSDEFETPIPTSVHVTAGSSNRPNAGISLDVVPDKINITPTDPQQIQQSQSSSFSSQSAQSRDQGIETAYSGNAGSNGNNNNNSSSNSNINGNNDNDNDSVNGSGEAGKKVSKLKLGLNGRTSPKNATPARPRNSGQVKAKVTQVVVNGKKRYYMAKKDATSPNSVTSNNSSASHGSNSNHSKHSNHSNHSNHSGSHSNNNHVNQGNHGRSLMRNNSNHSIHSNQSNHSHHSSSGFPYAGNNGSLNIRNFSENNSKGSSHVSTPRYERNDDVNRVLDELQNGRGHRDGSHGIGSGEDVSHSGGFKAHSHRHHHSHHHNHNHSSDDKYVVFCCLFSLL